MMQTAGDRLGMTPAGSTNGEAVHDATPAAGPGTRSAPMVRRLRLLHVTQTTTGGSAACIRDLVVRGMEEGFDVAVASPADGELPRWTTDAGAQWIAIPFVRSPRAADIARILEMRQIVKPFDVVHLHSSKAGAVGRLAMATLGPDRPACVFTPHAWSWLVGGTLAPSYRRFERVFGSVADVIVAVSAEERELGVPVLGRAADRIRVIPNGVDPVRYSPEGSRAERGPEPLIVCVGRLATQKGQDVAIRALAEVPGAHLRLLGDGPRRESFSQLAVDVGVADRVEMLGQVSDPRPHIRAADIVLVPSRWDGQSLALLEAMSCGAAVVACEVAGAAALQGVGVLVPPDNPPALADAIRELVDDPERREALGYAARARILDEYSLDRTLARSVAVWRSLYEARRSAGRNN